MSMRALWKGVIRFGEVSVPVKFYSAVEDRNIHFRLLHETDHTPVKQQMVDPRNGKPVPREQIRRGLETDTGEIVMISPEELDSLNPEPSREIEITRFVDQGRINYQWYVRPYFLGPDGIEENYVVLARALEKEKKEGIARWTMRNKSYIGALDAKNGQLKLITLRYSGEVVNAAEIPRKKGRNFEPMELKMAEQLVDALAGDFDPTAYRNEYRRRVMDLINTKALGNVYRFEKAKKRRAKFASLTDTLKQSLDRVRKEKKSA